MLIAVIADDLTGCGDAGIFFRQAGFSTQIINFFSPDNFDVSAPVVIINTESRTDTPRTAYKKVKKAANFFKTFQPDWIYKKIDSTLRGNIGTEIDALLAVFPVKSLPLVAAFPQMGRTTLNGWHYLNGSRLEAHIPTLIRKTSKNWKKIKVYDAASENDLRKIAEENIRQKIFCGAAGLVKHILQTRLAPISPKVLIVAGSLNPVSINQVEKLRSGKVDSGQYIILKVKRKISSEQKEIIARENIQKLILVGGQTAYNVCKILKINNLSICKTVLPGIAHCHSPEGKEIILKPGGFGSPETLIQCLKYFQKY